MEQVKTRIIGKRPSRQQISFLTVAYLVGGSILFLVELDTVVPFSGLLLGILLLAMASLIAGYAGWNHGGAITGVGAVLLTVLWMAFLPPIIGYLKGLEWANPRYSTVRLSDVMMTPAAEIGAAVRLLPVYVLFAVILGSGAFLAGTIAKKLSTQTS